MEILRKLFNKEKSPPHEVELTHDNLAEWPSWHKLVEEGKVIIDAQGKLRYPHSAPVGKLVLARINKDGTPIYKESAVEWFDPDSAMAENFVWPK